MREVDALAEAGADIIAVDCTDRKRGDGLSPWEYIGTIKERYPDQILMADISDYQEGIQAWKSGIDLVSTTMSGYTDYTPRLEGAWAVIVGGAITRPLEIAGRFMKAVNGRTA